MGTRVQNSPLTLLNKAGLTKPLAFISKQDHEVSESISCSVMSDSL